MSWRSNQSAQRSLIARAVYTERKPGPSADRHITPKKPGDMRGPRIKVVVRNGRVVGASAS